MSYEHSTASGMHDLLDKLKTFLENDGWTINQHSTDSQMYSAMSGLTASGSKRLHVSKVLGQSGDNMECFFNFRSAERLLLFQMDVITAQTIYGRYHAETRGIGINAGTGYDSSTAGSNWDQQPGVPRGISSNEAYGAVMTELSTTSIPYWFFSNGDTVVVVAEETRSGYYQHMVFGRLTNKGGYTGGMFYSASVASWYPSLIYWSNGNYRVALMMPWVGGGGSQFPTNLYCEADSVLDWRPPGYDGDNIGGYSYTLYPGLPGCWYPPSSWLYQCLGAQVISRTPNTVNALNCMMPILFMVKQASGRYFHAGYPEGCRVINRSNYNAGDSFVLGDSGGDEWVVFPVHTVHDTDDIVGRTAYPKCGIAYKKVI